MNKKAGMEWDTMIKWTIILVFVGLILFFPKTLKEAGTNFFENLGITEEKPKYTPAEVGTIRSIEVANGAEFTIEALSEDSPITPAVITKLRPGEWTAKFEYMCQRGAANQFIMDAITFGGEYTSATTCDERVNNDLEFLLKNEHAVGKIELGTRTFTRDSAETQEWTLESDDEEDGTSFAVNKVAQNIYVHLYKLEG